MSQSAEIFWVLSHPLRLEIVDQLSKRGELHVSGLKTEHTQSSVSQHLAVLRKYNLVHTRKQAKWVYYSLNQDVLDKAKQALEGI